MEAVHFVRCFCTFGEKEINWPHPFLILYSYCFSFVCFHFLFLNCNQCNLWFLFFAEGDIKPVRRTQIPFIIYNLSFIIYNLKRS